LLSLQDRRGGGISPPLFIVYFYAALVHDAKYWEEKTRGMDFSAADNLDTARFNRVLWQGLKGDSVPYPSRSGADLRQNRKSLLEEFNSRTHQLFGSKLRP